MYTARQVLGRCLIINMLLYYIEWFAEIGASSVDYTIFCFLFVKVGRAKTLRERHENLDVYSSERLFAFV